MPALALLAVGTRELLWVTAGGILISNLDDLVMDALWIGRVALRSPPPVPSAPAAPSALAVFIPAWDEAAVIGAMLTRFLATQRHARYRLFVGVYPNDPATLAAVLAVQDPRIIPVSVGHPGPTTKADCLNHLCAGMRRHEADTASRFDAIILHDCEDVVHPGELALFDRHLGHLAMVQVPVLPLPDPASRWISGHYLDEFAQNHIRDMMVRGCMGAAVPSAGVGTAIRRDALDRLAADGDPFDASSLTEDYEIGHKLHAMGFPARMVRETESGELIAVREYFPATLDAAVRQKSRWLTGIALIGWDRLGWQGPPAERWMLMRDRKGLFTSALSIVAQLLLALIAVQVVARWLAGDMAGVALPPLILGESNPLLSLLLLLNATLLVWRMAWRAGFTGAAHGLAEALRSVPRAFVANVVNALAAWRALERYQDALGGAPTIWGKTVHRFPDSATGHG